MKKVNFSLYVCITSCIATIALIASIFLLFITKDEQLSGTIFKIFIMMVVFENLLYWFYVKQLKSK